MPNQVSKSVRLILKPFLFDYNIEKNARSANIHVRSSSEPSKFQVVFSRYLHAHNKLFERALHAVPFTLMAAKAINGH